MYKAFYGLLEKPFSKTPDPRFLYLSARHREGLAHLLFGSQQPGGFVEAALQNGFADTRAADRRTVEQDGGDGFDGKTMGLGQFSQAGG